MSMETNKSIKIPDAHYVGFQKRAGDTVPLGFMTPDGTDSAATKRKSTVDNWAGGGGYSSAKQATLPAKTFDNKPLVGFKMGKNISYGGGWDSRHDKWRIEDPRGFALEITSGNLQKVMELCTIERGEIQESCIWGRLGTENVLVPISSDIYTNAIANTQRMAKKGSIRDAEIGDRLIFKNGNEAIYLGKMIAFGYRRISTEGDSYYRRIESAFKHRTFENLSDKSHYAILTLANNANTAEKDFSKAKMIVKNVSSIELKDSLNISEIVSYNTGITQAEACDFVNEWISNRDRSVSVPKKVEDGNSVVLQVAPNKLDETAFIHSTAIHVLGDWPTYEAAELKIPNNYYNRGVLAFDAAQTNVAWYSGVDSSRCAGCKPNLLTPNPKQTYHSSSIRAILPDLLKQPNAMVFPDWYYDNSNRYSYSSHRSTEYRSASFDHLADTEIFMGRLVGTYETFSGKKMERDYTNDCMY